MAEDFLIGVGKDNREPRSNREDQSQEPPTPPSNNGGYDKKENNKKVLKGCGIGCLAFVILFFGFSYWVGSGMEDAESKDLRIKYFKQDMERLSSKVSEENIYTSLAKVCIDSGVYFEGSGKDVNKSNIQYFTRRNDKKLLILLKATDLQDVTASTRRVFVEALLDCFQYVEDRLEIEEYYILLEGKWNTLLVYTPEKSDLGGRFANEKLLLPFYDEYVKDSLPSLD